MAHHFVDFKRSDLFGFGPGAKSSLRRSDVNRALKLNFDGLHFLVASCVVRDDSHRAGLAESVSILIELSGKSRLLLGAHTHETSLELLLVAGNKRLNEGRRQHAFSRPHDDLGPAHVGRHALIFVQVEIL